MYWRKSKILILFVSFVLCTLLFTVISTHAQDAPQKVSACDPEPAGWPTDTIERADFCVYYDSDDTTLAQATQFADDLEEQLVVYAAYGWPQPTPFLTKWQARLIDAGTDCNGFVSTAADIDELRVYQGCGPGTILGRNVVGHEFDHLAVQLRGVDHNLDSYWMHEGMARSGEDKKLADSDHYAAALADPFTYEKEVNEYLSNTTRDITTILYESVLWWTYFAEQCGSTPADDVGRGVADSFLQLWDSAVTHNDIAAVNHALSNLGCPNFNTMFQDFAVAIYAKDLSGLPDDSYNFLDEDEPGNLFPYGPLVPDDGGTIDSGTNATFNNNDIPRYAVDHFKAAPDAADCLVPVVTFHDDNTGTPAFYDVLVDKSGVFGGHYHGTGDDWSVAFLNGTGPDQISELVASVGSLASASPSVDVEFSCANPSLDILQSTQLSPDHVQSGDLTVVLVRVTNGALTGPVVGGLSNADFDVTIGGSPALVVSGGFAGEIYALLVQTPSLVNGPYTLEVELLQPGTATVIATDSELEAIVYDAIRVDNVLIMDRSGSMTGDKIDVAKAALNLFKDASNNTEGLAAVAYNNNVNPTPVDMGFGTLLQKNDVEAFISGLTATGGTSIGDGLAEAADQCDTSPTGNPQCLMILASDGQENSSQYVADVIADVIDAGKVLALSIGPGANETLMQSIAADTGGMAYYVDTNTSSAAATQGVRSLDAPAYSVDDMALAFGRTYLTMQAVGEDRQEYLNETGGLSQPFTPNVHKVMIDPLTSQALFVLDWHRYSVDMVFRLKTPSGKYVEAPYTFADTYPNFHLGYRINDPEPGEWTLEVSYRVEGVRDATRLLPYQVTVGGHSQLQAFLLPLSAGRLSTGDQIHLCGLFPTKLNTLDSISAEVSMMAEVTAPNGLVSPVQFYDDGLHDDGRHGDGLFCGFYTLGNQANEVSSDPEDGFKNPPPLDEGTYIVDLHVVNEMATRRLLGAITLAEGTDTNGDGLPDSWNKQYGSATGDPDLDLLTTGDEYLVGTHPLLSDTDGGGENDGSEVRKRQDPLDPSDDNIAAPDFFSSTPQDGGKVLLRYDLKGEYVRALIYRSTSMKGPWTLLADIKKPSGVYVDGETRVGTQYFYRFLAINTQGHWSRVLDNQGLSAEDATPPDAGLLINGGALETSDRKVLLSFIPTEYLEAFEDIAEVKIANSLDGLEDAKWQAFEQDIGWNLPLSTKPGEVAIVYALLKDDAGNESTGPISAGIIVRFSAAQNPLYLPFVSKK